MKVTAVIVEDEPLARESLRGLVDEIDWIEAVGEAADGVAAVRLIDRKKPDVVFLDVELPELTGLQVLERVNHRPRVVFTTAYDRYAVTAFEFEAVDYLVKPFGRRRFRETLERVRKRIEESGAAATGLASAQAALGERFPSRLYSRTGNRIVPIPVETVMRLEAADDYVEAICLAGRHLLDMTLAELEARLDPQRFCRVHRSHIVNLDHVTEMRKYDVRRLTICMRDGSEVVASRRGSQKLRDLMP
ncbi:MAG: LytTR family DNA-binding domain-containing protein [Acidobacteriota bacterium]